MRLRRPAKFFCVVLCGLALGSCAHPNFREDAEQFAEKVGLMQRDEREAMLHGEKTERTDRVLPPPREFREKLAARKKMEEEAMAQARAKAAPAPASVFVAKALPAPKKEAHAAQTAVVQSEKPAAEQIHDLNAELLAQYREIGARLEELNRRVAEAQQVKPAEVPKVIPASKPAAKPEEKAVPPAGTGTMAQVTHEATNDPKTLTQPEPKTVSVQRPAIRRPAKVFMPDAQTMREQARQAFAKILKDYPHSDQGVEACMNLAKIADEDGEIDTAIRYYERVLENYPQCASAPRALMAAGKLYREAGNQAKAREYFLGFCDRYPLDREMPDALLSASSAAEAMDDYPVALSGYRDVLQRFGATPAGETAKERYADLLLKSGQVESARAIYSQLAAHPEPTSDRAAEASIKLAKSYLQQAAYGKAREVLISLLGTRTSESLSVEASALLAETYVAEEEYFDAARAYLQTADAFPAQESAAECRLKGAECLSRVGLNERAQVQFRRVLVDAKDLATSRRNRLTPAALLGLLKAQNELHDAQEASKTLAELRLNWKDTSEARLSDLEEVRLLLNQDNRAEAVAVLDRIARKAPGTARAREALLKKAEIEAALARHENAAESLRGALSAEGAPQQAAASDLQLAGQLVSNGKFEDALRLYRRVSGSPEAPVEERRQAEFQGAALLERLGQIPDAIKAYRVFVQRNSAEESEPVKELVSRATWKAEKLAWLQSMAHPAQRDMTAASAQAPAKGTTR